MSSPKVPLRLLIVEDSADDAFFLARTLKREGYEVDFSRVDTSVTLRQALEQESWDAIISDYQMPGFDGLAALEIYKEYDLDIPFIVVSGAIGEETAVKVMKAGAHDYLLKDNLTRLVPAIQRELQEAKIRQERREALLALQHSESRYRAIVEDQTELINRCTLDGTITYVNNAYARLHRRTPEEFIGGKYENFVSKEDAARLENIRSKLSPENPVTTSESCFEKETGEVIWVQWLDRLILDDQGNPFEYQGVGRDITDQKLAEEELKEFAANLERRAVQLQVAAEIARDATSIRELNQLLQRAVNLVRDRFGFYHAGVFLLDEKEEYAVLKAATGDPGQVLIEKGHKLKAGKSGIVGYVVGTGQPRTSPDVRFDSVHLIQPLLPETRSEMALPLKVGERVIGALDVQSEEENAFDEQDVQILQTMADQLAIAIDNLRLFAEVQQRAKELESLYSAALVTSIELEIDTLLDRLYEQVQRFIAPDSLIVSLYNGEKEELSLALAIANGKPIEAFTGLRVPLDEGGLSGYVIQTRKSLIIGDLKNQDLPVEPIRDLLEETQTRTWLGVPLIVRDQILGVVSIQSFQPETFGKGHQRFLESLSAQFAIAYENARLFEAERLAREQAETLREITRVIGGSLELDHVLSLILEQVKRVLEYDTASVLLLDEKQKKIALVAGLGYEDTTSTSQSASSLLKDSPILEAMSEDLLPVIISDVRQHPGWVWIPGAEHVRSFLGVPIIARNKMIGALMVDRILENAFSEEDARTIQVVAQHIAIAIETARLFEAERAQLLLARTLQEVGLLLTSQLGLSEVLERILDLLGRAVQYDSVSIQLMEQESQLYYAAGRGLADPDEADRIVRQLSSHNLAHFLRNDGKAVVITDTAIDENWLIVPEFEYIRSWVCAPLLVRGKLIGLLTVDSRAPETYSEEVATTVMAFANQAAIAIENAQLFEAERLARERAEALREAAQVINSTLSLNQVIEVVLEQLSRVLAYDSGSVILVDGEKAHVQAGCGYEHIPEVYELSSVVFDMSVETIRYVVQERKTLVIPDVLEDERWYPTPFTEQIRSWMGVPLQVRDQIVGLINLERRVPGGFSDEEISLAQVFATQTSTAIENARLFEAEEKRAGELETLRQVGLSLTASLEPEAVLQAILEGVFKLIPEIWHANLYLYQEEKLTFGAALWGNTDQEFQLADIQADGPIYSVAISGEMIAIPYFTLGQLFIDLQDDELRGSIVSFPLKIGERVTGVMSIIDFNRQEFPRPDLRVLNLLADQAALAIENARLFQQTTTERRHIALLYDLGRSIAVSLEPDRILQAALDLTCSALGGNIGTAWLYLPDEKHIRLTAFFNQNGVTLSDISGSENVDLKFGIGLVGWVAENQTPVNIACLQEDQRWIPVDYIDDAQSMLAAPILEGENLLGVIALLHHQVDAFNDNHLDLLQAICQQISLALSNARRYQDVDRLVSLLAAEQYRLEGLIEMLPVGVLLLDEKQNLLVTNSLAREFLEDLAPDEATGLSISHLGQYSISHLLEQHSDLLSKEIILTDPVRKIFEIQAQPLNTEFPQWVVTLRDVTQEREIQDRIQMQERLATVGQLAAGIAHDFNNIMAAIVVYADLLLMDSSLSPSSQERLIIIQQQVQRAASLIRQILDFSRRSVMEQNMLDLLPFLKELEKLLKRTLPETISVELIYQDEAYILLADPTRLQQVFMNLAVNARDAMPEGGSLRFEVSHLNVLPSEIPPTPDMPPGKWIYITVADNGLGIPQKDQSHIFEPFFTTKPIGEGTGLGLAQVYGIIKQHGGFIDMVSQINEGTQFNIYLPSYSENDVEPKKVDTSLELDGAGKTVLLVEDDQATRKALEAMLSVHNYYVLVAENGVKALELLEKNADSIVLVLSDIVMPKMGGLDLYEKLQSRWPQIQALFITGHPLDEKNQQILEQGKVRWLQKPFTIQEFNQVLIELLT